MKAYNPSRAYQAAQSKIAHELKQKRKLAPHGPLAEDNLKSFEVVGRGENDTPLLGVEVFEVKTEETNRQRKHEEYLARVKTRGQTPKQKKQAKITRIVRRRGPRVGLMAKEIQAFNDK